MGTLVKIEGVPSRYFTGNQEVTCHGGVVEKAGAGTVEAVLVPGGGWFHCIVKNNPYFYRL